MAKKFTIKLREGSDYCEPAMRMAARERGAKVEEVFIINRAAKGWVEGTPRAAFVNVTLAQQEAESERLTLALEGGE